MSTLLAIVLVLSFGFSVWQEYSFRKKLAKVKTEGYMEGWDDAAKTLKNYDLNAYLDTKMSKNQR